MFALLVRCSIYSSQELQVMQLVGYLVQLLNLGHVRQCVVVGKSVTLQFSIIEATEAKQLICFVFSSNMRQGGFVILFIPRESSLLYSPPQSQNSQLTIHRII